MNYGKVYYLKVKGYFETPGNIKYFLVLVQLRSKAFDTIHE